MTGEQPHHEVAAYLLGALDPAERVRFQQHLVGCERCRAELAELVPLVTPLDALRGQGLQQRELAPVLARVGAARRRDRRRHVAAGLAAGVAASAAVALAVAVPDDSGQVYRGENVRAVVAGRDWGMAVRLEAESLPAERNYVLFAVTRDGARRYVASWQGTGTGVELTGSCYLRPEQVSRVELVADGRLAQVLRRT